ncbi:MAG: S-layer homology domain-containing protein [Ruminococcaceae bacterium]|nr:S-layer homology domain-containing protein [Oscillospiraceae bacterium]
MKKKVTALLLAAIMTFSISVSAYAASDFTDLASTHWAYSDVMALAKGGLVNGMGDGTFQPDGKLTVAQLAKIICAAKGLGQNVDGYWAAEYIRICQNDVRCLPDLGAITKENYDVNCTRELAAYMIVNGLGLKDGYTIKIQLQDIPDWKKIDDKYSRAVWQAYNAGLLTGFEDGTFRPKEILTRAQACAILNRAGYTTAAEKPATADTTGKSREDLFATAKTWTDVTWREGSDGFGFAHTLRATDRKWGGVYLKYDSQDTRGVLRIKLDEVYTEAYTSEDYQNMKNFNPSTVVTAPSGFSYDARQLVKRIFQEAYPTGYEEAYQALNDVLKQDIFEEPGIHGASALRWIDGRTLTIELGDGDNQDCVIAIGGIGNKAGYESAMAQPHVGHVAKYQSFYGGGQDMTTMYELDK